jgi:serine/threonine-protein kinase
VTFGSPGDLIADRYELQRLLGRGGFGEVWQAVDRHQSHAVALKLVLSRDEVAAWREASVLTALRSEHILEVYNADLYVDLPYLSTALAASSLDAQAEPCGVEPVTAIDWMRRALRGLDLCHSRGLLHRDIKPHNIFLTPNGDAKLGDFGVAGLMDADRTTAPHGDIRIRAPELFIGGRASVRSDIYSAACTLYALLAGRLPVDGIPIPDIPVAVVQQNYPPIRDLAPHVSQALADKVRRGMALDPQDRFQTASEFDNALALPHRSRHFTPVAPHPGHARCWQVSGHGSDIAVCVEPGSSVKRFSVVTRRQPSGNRIRVHCFSATAGQLPAKLRTVFNALRQA